MTDTGFDSNEVLRMYDTIETLERKIHANLETISDINKHKETIRSATNEADFTELDGEIRDIKSDKRRYSREYNNCAKELTAHLMEHKPTIEVCIYQMPNRYRDGQKRYMLGINVLPTPDNINDRRHNATITLYLYDILNKGELLKSLRTKNLCRKISSMSRNNNSAPFGDEDHQFIHNYRRSFDICVNLPHGKDLRGRYIGRKDKLFHKEIKGAYALVKDFAERTGIKIIDSA